MADRDALYQHFGPKLLEAIVESFRDEINEVRQAASLSELKKKDIDIKIDVKLDNTLPYSWMSTET